jgi:hypothetical protein
MVRFKKYQKKNSCHDHFFFHKITHISLDNGRISAIPGSFEPQWQATATRQALPLSQSPNSTASSGVEIAATAKNCHNHFFFHKSTHISLNNDPNHTIPGSFEPQC